MKDVEHSLFFAPPHKANRRLRSASEESVSRVKEVLPELPLKRDLLIEYLHALQDRYGYLAKTDLHALAELLRISQAEVFEVASFYHHFELVDNADREPELIIRVCDGIACKLAGGEHMAADLQQVKPNRTRVISAPCVGRCDHAPIAVIHQAPVPKASASKVLNQLKRAQWEDSSDWRNTVQGYFSPMHKPGITRSTYESSGGYKCLAEWAKQALTLEDREVAFKKLEYSGLRGMGGAGFPTGRKWRIVASQPGPRIMAVNIDEGEPGTFKDRARLEQSPHQFFEGVLLAAYIVDIQTIYIYLRDEYHSLRRMLQSELQQLRNNPPAGLGTLPHIELRRGAGAYICGEESAMIESIEGKRGLPRLRPPYVAESGIFGQPTLVHNLETLFWVPGLLSRGSGWFTSQGRHGRKGQRSFSLSGRVRKPGVYLAPAGISLNELIHEYGGGMLAGHKLYGYLPGGASGGILPASLADVPLDFDTLEEFGCFIGSAAIVVFSDKDRAIDVARNLMRFFVHESCGQCTPCREGTVQTLALIEQDQWDLNLLQQLSNVMRDASICGLGQAAPNPIDSVIRFFGHELGLEGHMPPEQI